MRHGPLAIDLDTRDVGVDGRLVALTQREFDILAFLAQSPRQGVLPPPYRERRMAGDAPGVETSVSEHMHRIRRKLASNGQRPTANGQRLFVETVRGVGLRFVADG